MKLITKKQREKLLENGKTVEDAENICDKLNARLGLDRDEWTRLAAQSMDEGPPEPGDPPVH